MMPRIAAIGLLAFSFPAQAQPRQYAAPPADFAVEQASPQDLAAFGLPPNISPKLLKALRDPRLHTPPPVEGLPPMRMNPNMPLPLRLGRFSADFAAAPASSANWSGQVHVRKIPVPADSGTIEAEMIVSANTTHDGTTDFFAPWIGFGGWANDPVPYVLQAGVVCSSAFPCSAWYEYFPDFLINSFRVNDGDDVLIEVWHTSSDPHGHAIITDTTDGGFLNVAFDCTSCGGHDPFTGSSLEWVVERPVAGGALAILTNYHTQVMINGSYSTSGGGPGGGAPTNLNVEMVQNGTAVSDCATPNLTTMICEAYR